MAIHAPKKWFLSAVLLSVALGGALIIRKYRSPPTTNSYYVALGSSFAAGLGLGPRAPRSPIVSQRSINGYPQQLARKLNIESFTDMTSSGSTLLHVLNGGQMLLGPQIDALGPDTRLVTLTAGGNDIAYVGDLMSMAYRNYGGIIGSAVRLFWKGAKPANERNFVELAENLQATIAEIKRRSPQARIIIVTYPVILPPKEACEALFLTQEQVTLMRPVGEMLAQITRDIGLRMGATVVDMATLSIGHDACSAVPWVNGFKSGNGADFHPSKHGAEATANAIMRAISR
jgi:lysophospholipase L1-like esterase